MYVIDTLVLMYKMFYLRPQYCLICIQSSSKYTVLSDFVELIF